MGLLHFRSFQPILEHMEMFAQHKPTGAQRLSTVIPVVVGLIQIGITVPGSA